MISIIPFLLTFIVILWKMMKKPTGFPPGPIKWPVLGNIPQLKLGNKLPHQVIGKLALEYGDIMGFFIGSSPVVVLTEIESIREALTIPILQGRPINQSHKMGMKKLGVAFTDGEYWREQKRFALRHLRELGMGKRKMETMIHHQIKDMLEYVKCLAGPDYTKPVSVDQLLIASGTNIIHTMLTGKQFQLREEKLKDLVQVVRGLTTLFNATGGLTGSMPFLVKLFPSVTELPKLLNYRKWMQTFFMEAIKEHKQELDESNPSDIIDYFLSEMKKSDAHPSFHLEQLLCLMGDLVIAGSDTTSGTLSFGVLYMVLNPCVQAKVQKELDEVIGGKRLPSLDDKIQLPYTEATLNEIYRMSSIAPLSLPHAVLNAANDVKFRGYVIPKNSRVLLNIRGLHMNEKYWGDPENFRPERFLIDSGAVRSDEALLPFGLGKRICIGEALARNNIFLTFAALMQNFNITIPEGDPTPRTEDMAGGLVVHPNPFKVIMTPRSPLDEDH